MTAKTDINPGVNDPPDTVRIKGGYVYHTGPSPQTTDSLYWNVLNSKFTVTEMMDNHLYDGMRLDFTGWTEQGSHSYYSDYYSSHSWESKVIHYDTDFYLEAHYKKNHEITVQNSLVNLGNIGQVTIEDTVKNLPLTEPYLILKNDQITLKAIDTTVNFINYTFDHWSYQNSTLREITFIPQDSMTVTAYFTGIPQRVTGIHITDTPVGAHIHLEWDPHPNSTCQYKIWRSIKHSGITTGGYVATQTHSDTFWLDPDYIRTYSYTEDLLGYEIRAYYPTEGTTADQYWVTFTFGGEGGGGGGQIFIPDIADMSTPEFLNENGSEIKDGIKAFPNPFNPSTTIAYSISRDANVDISIYDMSGRLVNKLFRGFRQRGSYRVVWSGKNTDGLPVGSGIYLLCMRGDKEQFVKRLIMLK